MATAREGEPEPYRVRQRIGRGGYAVVHLCERRQEDGSVKQFAVKICNKSILRKQRQWTRVNGKMVSNNALMDVMREGVCAAPLFGAARGPASAGSRV